MTGETLGHYQVQEKLGAGGMGEVYRARDTRLNRFVAIKVLRAERVADASRKQRFIQEAQAASALNHPNIVVVHDINSQNGLDYMVMECVEGKTLDAMIPRQGMKLAEALKIAIQMADALSKAHAAGIVHRDLKPSNVMVSDQGHVKLLDFGLAKLIETTPSLENDLTRTQRLETEEGTIMGTAAYMSPEQAEGGNLDSRSDIFSFGAVLYEMVTGRRAFSGDSKMSTLSAILKDEPKALESAPPDLEKVIRRCLRKDPARRFQHMEDLKVALEEMREDSDSGRLNSVPAEAKRKGIPKWAWGAAAGLVVMAALGASRFLGTKPATVQALRKIPLTTFAGSERSPTFSPDGRQVAFEWDGEKGDNVDIYVKMVEGGDPLRLTRDPAPDVRPAWSPDGRFIAFQRSGSIYLISPLGGVERKVTDALGVGMAWTPDSKFIAHRERPHPQNGGVMLFNLATGERRKLTEPPATSGGDREFAFSPDGKQLAFARWTATSGGVELYVMPMPSGPLKQLKLSGNFIYEITWGPDGREIVASVEQGGLSRLWRVPVDGSAPLRIADLDDQARQPAVSAVSGRLVYASGMSDDNIWSLTGETKTQVIASTRRDFNPQISPDGARIAFISDRTDGWEVYVSDAQGGRGVQITFFGNLVVDGIRWSPEGREIAVAALDGVNRDIWVVPADGGPTRRMTTEPSDDARPSYSMDGKWIYFRSNRSGKEEIWKMPRGGGQAVQVSQGGGFEALETIDGKTLYFVRGRAVKGLWRMPSAGGEAQAVPGLEAVRAGRWGVTEDGVCYADINAPQGFVLPNPVVCWNSSTGKSAQMGIIDKPGFLAPPFFSVSRDGRRFLWHQNERSDSDLVLVENFR